jgi:hypothetical protein
MSRKVSWIMAGVAGLLAAGGVTAASATAAPPVAAPHWHVAKSVKTDVNGQFTAVVATGKSAAWAFDGLGFTAHATAWRLAGKTWSKVAFPSKAGEGVITAGASSPSDVWAFTDISGAGSRVLRWNGAKWSIVKTFPAQIGDASVVAGNDVWVFGFAAAPLQPALGVWHYNGHTWTRVSKNIQGGSALSATSVWGFSGTAVEHWNGHKWASTSVQRLLPAKMKNGLNDPSVTGILALSAKNVYAIGNGNLQDEGGPVVVLHYNGSKWAKVAQGSFGFGPFPEFSSDGSGGLWLPMDGSFGGTSFLVHYAGGKLTKATLPVSAPTITVNSVARVPGTTQQFAGGYTHADDDRGTKVVGVILQYSS